MNRQVWDGGVRSLDSPELKEHVKGEGRMVPVRAEGGLLTRKPAWSASVAVPSPAQTPRGQSRIINHSPPPPKSLSLYTASFTSYGLQLEELPSPLLAKGEAVLRLPCL